MLTVDIKHRSFEETLRACEVLGGVDLIVTSPPYPDARPGQYGGDASHDFTWPDYQRLGNYVARALKPGGFAAVNIDGPVRTLRPEVGSERSLIAFKLAIDWAERVGLRYVEHCVYAKLGMPGDFHPRWRSGFEPVHVFQRPGARGHFNPWAMTDDSTSRMRTYKHTPHRSGDGKIMTGKRTETHMQSSERKTLTTILRPVDAGYSISPSHLDGDHPAPFTARFADAFVLCYSPPSGLVCDPFMGSGTVALSCARNGRSVIGGDLGARESDERRWADIALERAMAIVDPAQRNLF